MKKQWYMFGGGVVGAGLTSWFAPKMIAWYFDPPVNIGVNCMEATQWSMANLQKAQAGGLILGVILGLGLSFLLRKKPPAAQ